MNNKIIEWKRKKLEQMRYGLESKQLNALRDLLSNDVIEKICDDSAYYFRTRLLTPLVTIFHMIGTAMNRDGSFQSSWHFNGQSGKSGSLAKARKRLPIAVWEQLHQWIVEQIQAESSKEECWRGHRVISVDGTCVSMSDEEELVSYFGRGHTRLGLSQFPLARLGIAFNLTTMTTVSHALGSYETSEHALLRRFLGHLQSGDLLVLDRLYSGANLYAEYRQAGLEFIARAHGGAKIEPKIIKTLTQGEDYLAELPISKQTRRKNRTLPKSICVRCIRAKATVRGRKGTFWLVTSLLDPVKYPVQEIRQWYKRRWKVETLIEELKIWLGADVLRSKTVEGIHKELYARIIALNLTHWLIWKASKAYRGDPDRISVSATVRLTAAYSLKMSTAPAWQLSSLYKELLWHIASSAVPYRPGRMEPRLRKREPRNYSRLKISRSEWRNIYVVAA